MLKELIESLLDIGKYVRSMSDAVKQMSKDRLDAASSRMTLSDIQTQRSILGHIYRMAPLRMEARYALRVYISFAMKATPSKTPLIEPREKTLRRMWHSVLSECTRLDSEMDRTFELLEYAYGASPQLVMTLQKLMHNTLQIHAELAALSAPTDAETLERMKDFSDALGELLRELEVCAVEAYDHPSDSALRASQHN